MTPCLFCQHSNPDGARFCNDCGTPLDMRPCTACNAVDKRTATHCYQCGAPFAEPDPGAPHAAPKLAVPKSPAPKVAAPRVAAPPPPVDFKFSPPFTKWGAVNAPTGDTVAPVAVAEAEADLPREPAARPDPGVVNLSTPRVAPGVDPPHATPEIPAISTPSEQNEALPPLIVTPPPREEDEGVRAPRPTRSRSRQRWVAVAALVALAALAFIVDRERLREAPATTVVTTSPAPASPSGRETSAPIRDEAPASPPGPAATPAEGCAPGVAALGLCDIGRTRGGR